MYSGVLRKQHTSVHISSLCEDKKSVKLFPKWSACRNLASQVSQQLLGEQSRQWGHRGHGPQGLVHLLSHFGGHSEGQVAVLPEAIRWRRRLQLTPHTTRAEKHLPRVFSRDSSMAPPGVDKKADTQQIPVFFPYSGIATSSHHRSLSKVLSFHSCLHEFWISKGCFQRSFS